VISVPFSTINSEPINRSIPDSIEAIRLWGVDQVTGTTRIYLNPATLEDVRRWGEYQPTEQVGRALP
jgi:hypothetical protein